MSIKNKLPEWSYLCECFEYDQDRGKLYWKERPLYHHKDASQNKRFNTRYSGKEAGRLGSAGYRSVIIDGVEYSSHRVMWKLVTKEDPDIIDHINGVKDDNRWCNIRNVSQTQNNHNRSISSNNTTGYKGVSVCKDGRFKAAIRIGEGERLFLGYFNKAEDAYKAYCEAADEHHKDYANYG